MHTAIVLWYRTWEVREATRGFGIAEDEQGRSIFLHHTNLVNSSVNLSSGDLIEFDLYIESKGYVAYNISLRV
jgi:cold shock CspA family protein